MKKSNKPAPPQDDKPKKQLSSSIASLRFMNRNKPATNASDPTTQLPSPALSFKSSTSRVVKSSSNSSLSSSSNKNTAPPTNNTSATLPTSVADSTIPNTATIPKNHKAEQWSYAQEGKLDQVISNTLSNYSMNTNQDTLLSSNSYACQEDNESIYSLSFYRQLEGEPTTVEETSSDYVRGGRLKFGTYKQEEIAITTEIDPSSALKRKKDDNIKLPIGISSTQNKKKKYKK